MINLIHNTCLWGQRQFDGWMITKARYCVLKKGPPVSYDTRQKKSYSRYALLETAAYDSQGSLCQFLEIFLMDTGASVHSAPTGRSAPTGPFLPFTGTSIRFTTGGLRQFLADSGDTNSIHYGSAPVVPGLWILSRLKDLYCRDLKAMELSIRFLHPVHTGEDILLDRTGSRVTGSRGDTACFILTIS